MIEVKHLVKCYGNNKAVDDLSFTVEKGQIYGFLGPNGAGKSTTMNIMTGYLGATQGEVLINGHNILSEPGKAKSQIGYLPEHPPLYTDMTVMEYLEFVSALKHIHRSSKQAQIEKIIEIVKIQDVKNRLIRNLSKGYKQRVGLAEALIGFPEIIILDEPTVGLDPQQIIEIRELIRSLSKDHTILLSSHILSEIREVCDHIMIIYKGRLVASDTPIHLEQQLKGNEHMELLVKGSIPECEEALLNIPDILSADCHPGEEENCTRILLTIKNQTDIRESIFWTFSDCHLPLLMMQHTKTTLEDIFLELTSDTAENEKKEEESHHESNL